MIDTAILDVDFINNLLCQTEREIFARVTVLTQDELPIEFIEGKATGGSINVDGKSAIRRSCSLTMVAEDLFINNVYWGLQNKFKLEIGIKNNIEDKYNDIIWFPQGIYAITNFDTNLTAKKWTVTIKGKDKMCFLNGEFGGNLPHNTDFGVIDTIDKNGTKITEELPVHTIIFEAVRTYGGEQPSNIIINDIEDAGVRLLEYRGNTPMYMFRKVEEDMFFNMTFNSNQSCYYFSPTGWTLTTISDIEHIVYDNLVDLDGENEPTQIRLHKDFDQLYYVAKFEYGEIPGYQLTDLTFPDAEKALKSKAGDSVVTLLDKIKKMLGNFEYFYNLEGKFVFQKRKEYNAFNWQGTEIDEVLYNDATLNMEKPVFNFLDDKLITSFKNVPKLTDLKNDFSIWGTKRSPSGAENSIHARYAIDQKPKFYKSYDGVIYIADTAVLDELKEILKQTAITKVWNDIDNFMPTYEIPAELDHPQKMVNGDWTPGWWDIRDWASYYKLLTGNDTDPPYSMKWYSRGDERGFQAIYHEWRGRDFKDTMYVWLIIIGENGTYWNPQHGGVSYQPDMSDVWQCNKYETVEISPGVYTTRLATPFESKDFPFPYAGCSDNHTYLEFLLNDVNAQGNQVVFYNPDFPDASFDQLVIERIEKEYQDMLNNGTIQFVDWREIIYRMAVDYNRHNYEDDFLYQVSQNNLDYYPSGQTGYERYYVDMIGFWRELYNPNPTPTFDMISYLEAPEYYRDENLYVQHSYRKLEMDEQDELVIDIKSLYVLDYTRDPNHPDIIPFLRSQYCKLEQDRDHINYDLYFYVDPETNMMNKGETDIYKLNQINLEDIYLKNRGPFITNETAFEEVSVDATNYQAGKYYTTSTKEGYYLYNGEYNANLTYYRENNNAIEGYEKVNVGLYQYEPNKYYEILASSVDYENWVYDYYISEAEEYDPYLDYYILQSIDGYEPITLSRNNQYARQYYKLINNNYIPLLIDELDEYRGTTVYAAINPIYRLVSFSDYLFQPNKYYIWKDATYSIENDNYEPGISYYKPVEARKHYYVKCPPDYKGQDDHITPDKSVLSYWVFKYPFGTSVGQYDDDYTNYAALCLEQYLETYGWTNLYIKTDGHIKFQDLDLNIQRLYYKQAGILTEYLANPTYDNYNNIKTNHSEIIKDIYNIIPKDYNKVEDFKQAILQIQNGYINSTENYDDSILNVIYLAKVDDFNTEDEYLTWLRQEYDLYLDILKQKNAEILKENILSYEQVHYKKANYAYNHNPETGDYWTKMINTNPEDLVFWFDFINGDTSHLGKYSVQSIGPRTKVINDKNVKAIYYKEVPNTLFVYSKEEKEKYSYQTGYTYIQLNPGMQSLLVESNKGKSAKEALDELLYTNSYATENTTIQTTPIYHLQPNTCIYVRNDDTRIDGEYLISKLTIPLDHKKMMSITATKVVPNII